ncbi:4-hydroxyphenylacetate 3-hydroxylase C-terminal domain-containing protein [Paenibacillus radicis (ex Gao et al. 2016)]|uniref:HpaB/PvcC/4-BUDH C-terminal domain-containing protein n=1 Tax=Paenibacillus radicis (ex Gao et al. 2016) TaxID=1737354 RepID=A0A917M1Z7_9BACL|nr:4-hydroxyphenylacetate 3-hydroxylase C-terminal domain-containing protein [Paenibacillus radicis (ex Gao et al. 2016)]GGG74075.1 hypothetical protein GCM10010918_32720 [Paenibacillus radicis (ex Gao et al. 2016)]
MAVDNRKEARIDHQDADMAKVRSIYENERHKVAHVLDDLNHPLRQQAYLLPRSLEELQKKRLGFYGLADGATVFASGWTDYAHSLLGAWYGDEAFLSSLDIRVKGHIQVQFRRLEKLRSVITTSLQPIASSGEGLPVVTVTPEGIVLRGTQTFGSDVLFADELFVFTGQEREAGPSAAALLPVRSKGLKLLPFGEPNEAFASGVQVTYEDVLVPWERILNVIDENDRSQLLGPPFVRAIADYQWVSRQLEALELTVGTAFALAEDTGLSRELHIQGDLGESIQQVETLKAFIHAAEIGAEASLSGMLLPAAVPLEAARKAGGLFYSQSIKTLRRIGAGTILGDLSITRSPEDSLPTLRQLAWQLSGSGDAAKRELHELYAFGDPIAQSAQLYRHYPAQHLRQRYSQFWSNPLSKPAYSVEEVQI